MIPNVNKIAPYQAKGRWYKAFIESTGTAIHLTNSDLEDASISSTYFQTPLGFHILDYKMDVHTTGGTSTTATNVQMTLRRMGDGKQACVIPAAALFDHMDLYVFGYFEQ